MPNVVRMKLHAALRHYLALSTLEAGGSEPLEARRHNDPVTSRRTALVVGGTGPTGPLVVNGLIERGYDVTILHTGRHQTDLIGSEVRRIYTDPFDGEATAAALGDESFDLVVAMYGRLRMLAPLLAGRCDHFVSIGGVGVYRGFGSPDDLFPFGMPVPLAYGAPLVGDGEETPGPLPPERGKGGHRSRYTPLKPLPLYGGGVWGGGKAVFAHSAPRMPSGAPGQRQIAQLAAFASKPPCPAPAASGRWHWRC